MTKRILEASLSVFLIACVIVLIVGFLSLKPFYDSGLKVVEESHAVLLDSKTLIKELTEGIVETRKTPASAINNFTFLIPFLLSRKFTPPPSHV